MTKNEIARLEADVVNAASAGSVSQLRTLGRGPLEPVYEAALLSYKGGDWTGGL